MVENSKGKGNLGNTVKFYVAAIGLFVFLTLVHMLAFHENTNTSKKSSAQADEQLANYVLKGGLPDNQLKGVHEEEDAFGPIDGELEEEVVEEEIHEDPQEEFEPPADSDGERFLPGSLDMDRGQVMQKCWVDSQLYPIKSNICTYSETYNLLYMLLPKSGSSTGRHVMKHDFAAVEMQWRPCKKLLDKEDVIKTVSVRNPLTRFYASYDESFVRKLGHPDLIPAKYRAYMEPMKGWEYKNYSALFDTVEGVKFLTETFERFVRDYDGLGVFDIHLSLQMPMMWNTNNNCPHKFDVIFGTKDMDTAFADLAEKVGSPPPKVIRGRSYPRRFNSSALSDATMQKICRLAAIDFCCLNFELPEPCRKESIPKGERVMCEWFNPLGQQALGWHPEQGRRLRPVFV